MDPRYDPSSRLGTGAAPRPGGSMPGPLGRVVGVIAGTVLAVSLLFVSVVAFGAVLIVGTIAGGWFWWKTRDLRRQLRGEMDRMQRAFERGEPYRPGGASPNPGPTGSARARPAGGDILEGDYIREAPSAPRADDSRAAAGRPGADPS